jgi:hypothetical protein
MTYSRYLAVGALLLAATGCRDEAESPVAPALESALQPVTLVSGNAAVGGRDAENRVSVDGGTTFYSAHVVDPFPAWAPPLSGSQWITAEPDFAVGGAPAMTMLFQRTFTLSEDPGDAVFTIQVHADNHATVSLNGTQFGRQPFVDIPENFNDPAETYVAPPGLLRQGINTLEIELVNFGPVDPAGLDYRATIGAPAEPLDFRQVSAGTGLTCGVTTDDRAYCWGNAEVAPVPVAGGRAFKQVSVGFAHVCGVAIDGRAFCWTHTIGDEPLLVPGGLSFRQVSAGFDHTCGLGTDDRVYCWGSNDFGELGDGSLEDQLAPVPVSGGRFYRQVEAAGNWSCGVTTDYHAFCWGDNGTYQLGDSTRGKGGIRPVPVPVAGGRRFRQVDGGFAHTCGVTLDYRIYCWGSNSHGQLGIRRVGGVRRWPAARVLGPQSFERVSTGSLYTCAEATDNRAYCWGINGNGQLGDGTLISRDSPVAVAGGHSFVQLTTGGFPGFSEGHSCGRTSASRAYCWGFNTLGELGDGTTTDRRRPRRVVAPL